MILRVVAEPSQIFWAPIMPAAMNIIVNIIIMMMFIVLLDVSPLPFFITTIIGHSSIAAFSVREPHCATLIIAWAESRKKTVNLLGVKGNKYVS